MSGIQTSKTINNINIAYIYQGYGRKCESTFYLVILVHDLFILYLL